MSDFECKYRQEIERVAAELDVEAEWLGGTLWAKRLELCLAVTEVKREIARALKKSALFRVLDKIFDLAIRITGGDAWKNS